MTRRIAENLALTAVRGVDIAHWNPLRRTTTWGAPSRRARPVRNFGDLLGPLVVRQLVREFGLAPATHDVTPRLLAIGSVLHLAEPGDVVWGAGLNAKTGTEVLTLPALDLRAVRGPRTHAQLLSRFGKRSPTTFGDPGLLLGALFPHLLVPPQRRHGVSVVPNLNELAQLQSRDRVVNPRWPLRAVVRRIARSELVVGSSLHGIIVAESLGVPARAVRTSEEGSFKYEDYYLATGRDPHALLADSVEDAIARGGTEPPLWDPRPLLDAFPTDLWSGGATPAQVEHIAGRGLAGQPPPRDQECKVTIQSTSTLPPK